MSLPITLRPANTWDAFQANCLSIFSHLPALCKSSIGRFSPKVGHVHHHQVHLASISNLLSDSSQRPERMIVAQDTMDGERP